MYILEWWFDLLPSIANPRDLWVLCCAFIHEKLKNFIVRKLGNSFLCMTLSRIISIDCHLISHGYEVLKVERHYDLLDSLSCWGKKFITSKPSNSIILMTFLKCEEKHKVLHRQLENFIIWHKVHLFYIRNWHLLCLVFSSLRNKALVWAKCILHH